MFQPNGRHRSVWVLLTLLIATVVLSECSSSTPGLLTQSDIPSYLAVTANASATNSQALLESAPDRCKQAGVAIFSRPRASVIATDLILNNSPSSPEIISTSISCPSESDAHLAYETYARDWGRHSILHLGAEADLGKLLPSTRNFIVGWRQNTAIGWLLLAGAPDDKRITPALAELLARRAAARS